MEDSHHREARPICLDEGGWDSSVPQMHAMHDKLCQLVRSIYVHHRRRFDEDYRYGVKPVLRYDGGTDRSGNTYPVFWPTLLRHFLRLQVDPEAFTAAQFKVGRHRKGKVPLPPYFLRDTAFSVYKRFEAEPRQRELAQMQRDREHVRGEALSIQVALKWDAERATRYGLYNRGGNQLMPLVRYCLAVEHDCEDVAEYYHDEAVTTYMFQPHFYDEAEVVQIPQCLKEESRRLVDWILSEPESD